MENNLVDTLIPLNNLLMKLIHQREETKKNQSKNRGIVKYRIVPAIRAVTPLRAPISVGNNPDSCNHEMMANMIPNEDR